MDEHDEHILRFFEQHMERLEKRERDLIEAEERRQRIGVYERYQRFASAAAKRTARPDLEREVERLALELKRAMRKSEIQIAREKATAAWLDFEGLQGYVDEAKRVRKLLALPAEHGKKAREARWAGLDEVRAFVAERWAAKPWRTKAEFARAVEPEVRAIGGRLGRRFSEDNLVRTIREWIPDKSSGTAAP